MHKGLRLWSWRGWEATHEVGLGDDAPSTALSPRQCRPHLPQASPAECRTQVLAVTMASGRMQGFPQARQLAPSQAADSLRSLDEEGDPTPKLPEGLRIGPLWVVS